MNQAVAVCRRWIVYPARCHHGSLAVRHRPRLTAVQMQYSTKVGLSALLTVGVVVSFYRLQQRRNASLRSDNGTKAFPPDVKTKTAATDTDTDAAEKKLATLVKLELERAVDAGENQNQKEAASDSQWQSFSNSLRSVNTSIASIDWTRLTTNLSNVFPDWAIGLPDWITSLQRELNMKPGSLADEIWSETRDPAVNPEVAWDARVRLGVDLCEDEKRFLLKRRMYTRKALAKYLGLPEEEIHEEDIPIIAATGSGGGLRAMVAGAGYYQALAEAGLFDCTTYTAGVSGSCWLQGLYLSSIGQCSFEKVAEHLKSRIDVHIAYPPKALELLNSSPTNKYLLRGVVEKLKMGYSSFGLVDLYGLLLGARLLVPNDELTVNDQDLKLSSQRKYLDAGEQPLPIYTAVRHEIMLDKTDGEKKADFQDVSKERITKPHESWFQWFETTPYEFFCEDLEAGIPTWAMGRRFENGVNVDRRTPELRLPFLFGVFGSAFCATLSHYYHEIRPFITSVGIFLHLDKLVLGRTDDLVKVHPIDPASIPNYVKGLKESLPSTCPESLWDAENIQLMDAGMSNNLACYPLLRHGRNIDILLAFDSSAEIQTANWIGYAEGYAKQRKIQGWPVSIGWPRPEDKHPEDALENAQARSVGEAREKFEKAVKQDEEKGGESGETKEKEENKQSALGYCTIWVGSKVGKDVDREPPPSKAVEEDWELQKEDAGITVVYFPLIPNPKVPNVDPESSPYLSTWNFEWTPEQVEQTIVLAKANFKEGEERLKRTVRAVYERKKKGRLEREGKREEEEEEEGRRRGSGDQFS